MGRGTPKAALGNAGGRSGNEKRLPGPLKEKNMYRVIIYGCPDEFAMKVHGRVFNRRGLIRFLSRHVSKLIECAVKPRPSGLGI